MRFRFIEDHRAVFVVRVMCAVLEVSASGYYAWRRRPDSARTLSNRALVDAIRRVHAESRRRYGSPRVHAALRAEGSPAGRNRVAPPDAAAWHPGPVPAAVPDHDRQQPCLAAGAQPAGTAVHGSSTKPSLAGRHHLRADRGGLARGASRRAAGAAR